MLQSPIDVSNNILDSSTKKYRNIYREIFIKTKVL